MPVNSKEGWTSIPVRPSTRDRVSDIKRAEESWNDALNRLVTEKTRQGNH
jgi:hypothetical protein